MSNDNKQKAGDGATQLQIGVLNVGISEERAREICHEMFAIELKNIASEGFELANKRSNFLDDKIVTKFETSKETFDHFRKPEFLHLVQLAERSAMETDREQDYDILVNLLFNKTQKDNDRKFGTGVKQAIQVVNEIDDETDGSTPFQERWSETKIIMLRYSS